VLVYRVRDLASAAAELRERGVDPGPEHGIPHGPMHSFTLDGGLRVAIGRRQRAAAVGRPGDRLGGREQHRRAGRPVQRVLHARIAVGAIAAQVAGQADVGLLVGHRGRVPVGRRLLAQRAAGRDDRGLDQPYYPQGLHTTSFSPALYDTFAIITRPGARTSPGVRQLLADLEAHMRTVADELDRSR
jgi:hypothetical protein